ncbi:MAG: YgjV family protein [Oscillospiraceae bacterium]|nr:YgjV family protein [Oscillospiraceae bacterium]
MPHNVLIGQLIGFVGVIAVVIGMQQKSYDRIVLCKILNSFFGGVHYIFLGGYTGMVINLASIFTSGVYWYRNKKNKNNLPFQIIFGISFVILALLSWDGPISLFVVAAKLLSSVALGIKNPRAIRFLNSLSSPCWLVYNAFMGSIPGIVGETLITLSTLTAIVRLDILHKQNKAAE